MGEYENLDDFKCSVYTGEAGACPCFCAAVFSGITRHAAAAGAGSAKVSSSWDPVIILARGPLSLWVKTKPEMTPNARAEEILATSLRTTKGIHAKAWDKFIPDIQPFNTLFNEGHDIIRNLCQNRLLIIDDLGVRATTKGLNVIDAIVVELLSI
ncbi:hypothetical protein EMCRGX_G027999 [Ephydatia muelleri]